MPSNHSDLTNLIIRSKEKFFKSLNHWILPENESETRPDIPSVDDLAKVVVDGNWKLPSSRLPHWLIHDAGPEIEHIANSLVSLVGEEMGDNTSPFLAGEMKNEPGVDRPLRFVHKFQPGHISATDVVMRAEGRDLYVRVQTKPRTLLTYLRYFWLFGLFFLLSSTLLVTYFMITDAKRSWAQDFAARVANERYPSGNKQDFVARCIQEGFYRTEWHRVRKQLRKKPELVEKIQKRLIQENESNLARTKHAREEKNTDSLQMILGSTRQSFFLMAMIPTGEGMPDFAAESLLEDLNNDLYGVWRSLDEDRAGTVGLKTGGIGVIQAIDQNPLLFTESLAEVGLAKTVTDGFNEPALTRIINSETSWKRPYSFLGLCLGDPRGSLLNVLAPCGIIGSIVGFFVWRSPRSWLRHPCKLLGWIRPDDFESQAVARNGRVIRLLSLTLQDLGFDRTKISELGEVEPIRV